MVLMSSSVNWYSPKPGRVGSAPLAEPCPPVLTRMLRPFRVVVCTTSRTCLALHGSVAVHQSPSPPIMRTRLQLKGLSALRLPFSCASSWSVGSTLRPTAASSATPSRILGSGCGSGSGSGSAGSGSAPPAA
eukprot:COSAG04_NODE_6010_length_1434_cov_1.468165_1_plen_131_part_10